MRDLTFGFWAWLCDMLRRVDEEDWALMAVTLLIVALLWWM